MESKGVDHQDICQWNLHASEETQGGSKQTLPPGLSDNIDMAQRGTATFTPIRRPVVSVVSSEGSCGSSCCRLYCMRSRRGIYFRGQIRGVGICTGTLQYAEAYSWAKALRSLQHPRRC